MIEFLIQRPDSISSPSTPLCKQRFLSFSTRSVTVNSSRVALSISWFSCLLSGETGRPILTAGSVKLLKIRSRNFNVVLIALGQYTDGYRLAIGRRNSLVDTINLEFSTEELGWTSGILSPMTLDDFKKTADNFRLLESLHAVFWLKTATSQVAQKLLKIVHQCLVTKYRLLNDVSCKRWPSGLMGWNFHWFGSWNWMRLATSHFQARWTLFANSPNWIQLQQLLSEAWVNLWAHWNVRVGVYLIAILMLENSNFYEISTPPKQLKKSWATCEL